MYGVMAGYFNVGLLSRCDGLFRGMGDWGLERTLGLGGEDSSFRGGGVTLACDMQFDFQGTAFLMTAIGQVKLDSPCRHSS